MDHKINRIYEQNICPTINDLKNNPELTFVSNQFSRYFHGYLSKLQLFIDKIMNSVLTCHSHMFDMLYKTIYPNSQPKFPVRITHFLHLIQFIEMCLLPPTIEAISVGSTTSFICVFVQYFNNSEWFAKYLVLLIGNGINYTNIDSNGQLFAFSRPDSNK